MFSLKLTDCFMYLLDLSDRSLLTCYILANLKYPADGDISLFLTSMLCDGMQGHHFVVESGET